MKKIGIIGGLAWPSTVDYYRLLCKLANQRFRIAGEDPPFSTPPMVIESLNIKETRALRGMHGDEKSWESYDSKFRDAFVRLKHAGADFGMIASNTPHMRLHGIVRGLDLPVVSILEATSKAVASNGGSAALVLGTPLTMRSPVYPQALQKQGISALPQVSDEEMAEIEQLIDVDLYQGVIDNARDRIVEISRKHVRSPATELVCLACTELPLAFPEQADSVYFRHNGIGFINTIAAHVEMVLDEAFFKG